MVNTHTVSSCFCCEGGPEWPALFLPQFALGLVRLITATVEGKSYFQEAQCKSIVSEVDLCHTILALDANHPNAAKATLLNLFTHAYIDTESEVS